jgi:Ser/Thr protein kinase RdoA (MazF antagonist)
MTPVATPWSHGAVVAAAELARAHGLRVDEPHLLSNGFNVIVHLAPAPVVARIASVTAALRPRPAEYLARDVAIASHAAANGAPVVKPSGELPPGPHDAGGRLLTFWEYVEHDASAVPNPAEVARRLAILHRALDDFPGELPYLGPVFSGFHEFLDRLEAAALVPPEQLDRVRHASAVCAAALPPDRGDGRTLHGDAHWGNVLVAPHGLLWSDFEDACRGPVEWDLACLVRRAGRSALDAYGDDRPTEAELAPFLAARRLQIAVSERVAHERRQGRVLLDGVVV